MIYIPINGHNLTNVCSTWSISPAAYFPRRGFGFKSWVRSRWNPFEDVLLGFNMMPKLDDKADMEGGFPFLLAIPEELVEDMPRLKLRDKVQAVIIGHSLRLPVNVQVYVRKEAEWTELIAKARKSLEAKFLTLLEQAVRPMDKTNKPMVAMGDLETLTYSRPQHTSTHVEQDQQRNKIGGALIGLQIGAADKLMPQARSVRRAWDELREVVRLYHQSSRLPKGNDWSQRRDAALDACIQGLDHFKPRADADRETLDGLGYAAIKDEVLDLKGELGTLREIVMDRLQQRASDKVPLWRRVREAAVQGASVSGLDHLEESLMVAMRNDADAMRGIKAIVLRKGDVQGLELEEIGQRLMNSILSYFIQRTDLSHPDQLQEQRRQVVTEIGKSMGTSFPDWHGSAERKELLELLEATTAPIPKLDLRTMRSPVLQALALLILRGNDIVRFRDALRDADVNDPTLPYGLWGAAFGLANLPKTITARIFEAPGYDIEHDLFVPVDCVVNGGKAASVTIVAEPDPQRFTPPADESVVTSQPDISSLSDRAERPEPSITEPESGSSPKDDEGKPALKGSNTRKGTKAAAKVHSSKKGVPDQDPVVVDLSIEPKSKKTTARRGKGKDKGDEGLLFPAIGDT